MNAVKAMLVSFSAISRMISAHPGACDARLWKSSHWNLLLTGEHVSNRTLDVNTVSSSCLAHLELGIPSRSCWSDPDCAHCIEQPLSEPAQK